MPTYEFCCQESECKYEWEEWLSITAPTPDSCPKCSKLSVKKLISLGSKGVVELTGQDLVDKVKADTQQLKKDMHKSDKIYANMLGDDRYHKLQIDMDKRKREK